eukprot:10540784-Ditylum_brightwellii.AAC.1
MKKELKTNFSTPVTNLMAANMTKLTAMLESTSKKMMSTISNIISGGTPQGHNSPTPTASGLGFVEQNSTSNVVCK